MQVAEVVEFAHRNLVVHRDLKPSNILVDTAGRIRLLDFGVARIVDESLDDPSQTQTRLAPVTPSCAAPEQLRGGNITTATDVWALGVLLYQLLCDAHPFEASGQSHETTRRILEEEPELPSRRAREHGRRVRGDLDNILAKALAKDPAKRYGSVESFLEDLHRHLEGQPVLAHPPGAAYRAGKWMYRHRQALMVTAAILVAMGSLTFYYTRRVAAERDQALAEKARTEKVKQFVESLFIENDPSVSKGEEITAREMLDRGAARIEDELEEEPDIAADLHQVVGELYSSLGNYELSQDHLSRTVALRREAQGPDSPELAESLDRLGDALRELDDLDGAIGAMREALQISRKHPENRAGLASILNGLGVTLAYHGDYEEAEKNLREAVRLDTEVYGEEDRRTAAALANLGLAIKWNGDYDTAERIYRKVLAIRRVDPGRMTPGYAISLDNLGVLLGQRGDYEESEELFLEALDIRQKILGKEHPDVAMNLNNLATLYRVQGRLDKAEPMYRQVLALNRRIHGPRHRTVATNLHNLGSVLLGRKDYAGARKAFEEALDIRREALGPDHIEVAMTENELVNILSAQGELERAESLSKDAVEIARAAVGEKSPQLAAILANRGQLLIDLGHADRAKTVLEEAVSIQEAALSPDHWELGRSRALLGECLVRLETAGAESLLVKGLRSLDAARGDDFPATKRARRSLRQFYVDSDRTADAARLQENDSDGF
jgi:serine/threonine-protein kinase